MELWVYPGWPLRILLSGVRSRVVGGGEGMLLLMASLAELVDGGCIGTLLLVAFLAAGLAGVDGGGGGRLLLMAFLAAGLVGVDGGGGGTVLLAAAGLVGVDGGAGGTVLLMAFLAGLLGVDGASGGTVLLLASWPSLATCTAEVGLAASVQVVDPDLVKAGLTISCFIAIRAGVCTFMGSAFTGAAWVSAACSPGVDTGEGCGRESTSYSVPWQSWVGS